MKQTIFLGIFIFLFINPLSSEAAISTNWDNKTAFMLATTSHCAYMVNGGSNFVNKQRVLNCLLDAAKKNGDTLKEFIDLTEKDIETFVDSKVKDDNINAAILVKIPQGLIVAFRGTEPVINDWLNKYKKKTENVSIGFLMADATLKKLVRQLNAKIVCPNYAH